MVDLEGNIKIVDFGFLRYESESILKYTNNYLAPEVLILKHF